MTTIVALKKGGAEANPLMAKIFGAVGVIPGAIAVKLFVAGVVWYYRADMPVWAMGGTAATNPAEFAAALDGASRIGFVLGGGDGLGHGVYATGPLRLVVTDFSVK